MKNVDYIIRKDNKAKILSNGNDEKINISNILESDYNYLSVSINEDIFNLRTTECDMFKELLFNNQKVVGFVTYELLFENTFLLTNIYILPGYRRSSLFFNELKQQLLEGNNLIIYEPTRQVIEALISYGYARELTDNLVISSIKFALNTSTALSNTQSKFTDKYCLTNIYDLDICSSLSFKIYDYSKYEVYYTKNYEDDIRYGCVEKREQMDKDYFDGIVSDIIQKDGEIERWLFLLEHNVPSKPIDVEEIIGKTNHLSQTLLDSLEDGIITDREAKLIQNQLFIELRTGKVAEEALQLRLNYLIANYHEQLIKNNRTSKYCPYCYEDIDFIENYCTNCGYTLYNINDINQKEFVYKKLLEEKQSAKYTLTGIRESKNYFEEDYLVKVAMCFMIRKIVDGYCNEDLFDYAIHRFGIEHVNLEATMLSWGLIDYSMNYSKWKKEAKNFKNTELKDILKANNCKITGNKRDLIQRILKEVPLEKIQSKIPHITDKGIDFIEENRHLDFHYYYLRDYIFSEFEEYYNDNKEEYLTLLAMDFIEEHIFKAIETSNHDQLIDSLRIHSNLYSKSGDYDGVLRDELEIFMLNLNMIYIDPNYYSYYKPVDNETWETIYSFKGMLTEEEFAEIFEKVYKSFDEKLLIVSFEDTVRYLKEIFRHYHIRVLNYEIKERYYKRKFIKSNNSKQSNDNTFQKVTTLDDYF